MTSVHLPSVSGRARRPAEPDSSVTSRTHTPCTPLSARILPVSRPQPELKLSPSYGRGRRPRGYATHLPTATTLMLIDCTARCPSPQINRPASPTRPTIPLLPTLGTDDDAILLAGICVISNRCQDHLECWQRHSRGINLCRQRFKGPRVLIPFSISESPPVLISTSPYEPFSSLTTASHSRPLLSR